MPVEPEVTEGNASLGANNIFLYGIPKIGKTTLASQFPKALFIQSEAGTKHVSVERIVVNDWKQVGVAVSTALEKIRSGEWDYETIVFDTIDNMVDFCDDAVCQKYGLNVLGDLDYGKGYNHVKKALKKMFNELSNTDIGLVFVSHATEKEVDSKLTTNPYASTRADMESGKVKMITSTMMATAWRYFSGLCDMIWYMGVNQDQERTIHTKPNAHFEAGDRSGRLSPSISPVSYEAILNDYNEES